MSLVRVLAPAKLTWSLEVTGRRTDGYHELRSEMVTLDLADELVIEPGESGIELAGTIGAEGLSTGPDNLVARALALAGITARVRVTKAIPLAGGLGGGSADAGAVLRYAGTSDAASAVSLGGDVPFCVVGGRALVEGVGEIVTPLDFEDRSVVLLLPPFGVDTAACYRAYDDLVAAGQTPSGRNHLLRAALAVEPRLATWQAAFAEVTGREVVLAGSGSTLFVEGSLGADNRVDEIVVDGARGRLVEARTVPASWGSPTLLS
jgi:4-diphosphocytidyl-2-C-methyl-D-erythritol kinase